jgi:hypothetical protein
LNAVETANVEQQRAIEERGVVFVSERLGNYQHHVFVFTAAPARRQRSDRLVVLIGHPGCQVDVVSSEVFYDAHIANPGRKGTLASGDYLIHLAKAARREPLP